MRQLKAGTQISLDREPVYMELDSELGCLEVREHNQLYPLTVMTSCEVIDGYGDVCELAVGFDFEQAGVERLVFQFDDHDDRAGFAETLFILASQASHSDPAMAGYVCVNGSADVESTGPRE